MHVSELLMPQFIPQLHTVYLADLFPFTKTPHIHLQARDLEATLA